MTLTKIQYVQHSWKAARDYCEGVLDGSIVCNENIKLAVERHERDLQRDDLEWREYEVEKVYKFFSYLYVDKEVQFVLQPFQAFIILALFGLYFKDTGVRKYLYAFLFIARKNGKTTFASALQLYFMLGDGVTFPQSILVAGSQTQAIDTSFRALKEMIKCSPALSTRLEAMQSNRIIFKDRSRYGLCKTVPALEDRLEGLNPTSCILDEIHTYKDGQKFNVIKNALGTKKNPMLFLISTGGYGRESFCTQLVETGRKVLRGMLQDDRFFYMLYELEEGDDYENQSNWIKANPGLGTILDYKTLSDDFNTSKNNPLLLDDFQTKRLNMFLDENSDWIPTHALLPVFGTFNEETVKDLPCYVGVDLSATRDLTSIVCLFDGGDKFYAKSYFFFVKGENNSLRKGGINIPQWIKEGYIIECTTPTIDYTLVLQTIFNISNRYKVNRLCYDPWHFDRLLNEAKEHGIFCRPIVPGVKSFDPAVRFLEGLIYEKTINIYNNRCMLWNFRNTVIKRDQNGNIRPSKNESADAIDGVISLLNAVCGYLQNNTNAAARFMKLTTS